ncbi:hypothetical protein Tco_1408704 [Tanacetum coccineum]
MESVEFIKSSVRTLFYSQESSNEDHRESISEKVLPSIVSDGGRSRDVLEESVRGSYDSNLDESTFLVTPLSDSNEDECLAPRDDIELLLHF